MTVLRDQALPCEIWVTSVDLVSQMNVLLDVQWVWGNLLLLAETPHIWNQGRISDILFSTICVWVEAQVDFGGIHFPLEGRMFVLYIQSKHSMCIYIICIYIICIYNMHIYNICIYI